MKLICFDIFQVSEDVLQPAADRFDIFQVSEDVLQPAADRDVPAIRRVAIIDLDVHHGNGTEELVRQIRYYQLLSVTVIYYYHAPWQRGRGAGPSHPS